MSAAALTYGQRRAQRRAQRRHERRAVASVATSAGAQRRAATSAATGGDKRSDLRAGGKQRAQRRHGRDLGDERQRPAPVQALSRARGRKFARVRTCCFRHCQQQLHGGLSSQPGPACSPPRSRAGGDAPLRQSSPVSHLSTLGRRPRCARGERLRPAATATASAAHLCLLLTCPAHPVAVAARAVDVAVCGGASHAPRALHPARAAIPPPPPSPPLPAPSLPRGCHGATSHTPSTPVIPATA